FGAGHATFNYLRQFPLDALKLDRSLISGLTDDEQCETIVSAMIRLGNELGLDVIAEGIETPAQLYALRRIGCRCGQGAFISRPIPAHQIPQWQHYVHSTLKLPPMNLPELKRATQQNASAGGASLGRRWSHEATGARQDAATDDSVSPRGMDRPVLIENAQRAG
ncbi:MAG: EAL domain-containing protein, partial [Pseudomonadota bacterium]